MDVRVGIYAGSFDPITKGHVNIVEQALNIVDEVIVLVGQNSHKDCRFNMAQRVGMAKSALDIYGGVNVIGYNGLVTHFATHENINILIRGIRNSTDYQYEAGMAEVNRYLAPDIKTIFLNAYPALAHVSSSMARELLVLGGNVEGLVPRNVTLKMEELRR